MNATNLKLIALLCMTLDHICTYFPETPIWLRWIGRLSAMIFFFCAAESAVHTRNRKAYCKRLYIMSAGMAVVNHLLPWILGGWFTSITFVPVHNNIFSSIFQGVLVISILEGTKHDTARRKKYLKYYAVWQIIVTGIMLIFPSALFGQLLGAAVATEGPIVLTAVMLLFYFCRKSKKKLAVLYPIYCICYGLITVFDLPQHLYTAINWRLPASIRDFGTQLITLPLALLGFETIFSSGDFLHSLLEINFQWMMVFALPFLLSYNGKRGKGFKKLFYIYYPAHVYLFYLISVFLFK